MPTIPQSVIARAAAYFEPKASPRPATGGTSPLNEGGQGGATQPLSTRSLISPVYKRQPSRSAVYQQYLRLRARAEKFFDKYAQKFTSYTIHDAGQKESCQTCRDHDGQSFEFNAESKANHLPPFHPNCECYMEVEQQEQPLAYDVETGLIGEGATRDLIVNAINKKLNINTDWKTVAAFSFFQDENSTTDPAELAGEYTAPDANTPRIDDELRQEFAAIKKALEPARDDWEWFFKKPKYKGQVGNGNHFDLKNRFDNFWGYKKGSDKKRKHWAYIFEEKLLRYDQPGNIVAGYGAAYVGISLEDAKYWAGVAGGGTDDSMDADFIDKGYDMYLREERLHDFRDYNPRV